MSVKRWTWQDSRGGKEELLRCRCLGAGWHWKADTGRVDQEWSAQPIQGWQRRWCGRLLAKGHCVRSPVEEFWEQFLHVEFHFGTRWDRQDEGCYLQPKSELDMILCYALCMVSEQLAIYTGIGELLPAEWKKHTVISPAPVLYFKMCILIT